MKLAELFCHVLFLLSYTRLVLPLPFSLSFGLYICSSLCLESLSCHFCFTNSCFSWPLGIECTSVICWDPSVSHTMGIPQWTRPKCPKFITFCSTCWFTCLTLPIDPELSELYISTNTIPDNKCSLSQNVSVMDKILKAFII